MAIIEGKTDNVFEELEEDFYHHNRNIKIPILVVGKRNGEILRNHIE